jgi:hypothetical protein
MAIIRIQNVEYTILDTKDKLTIADSFVKRSNKIMTGNGEAKFYVGNDGPDVRDFFGAKGFKLKCLILKKDLLQYLKETEAEYKNPEQPYRNKEKMPSFWTERMSIVNNLDDLLWFNIEEQTQIVGSRIYVKSDETAFDLIRELSLPFITYISVMKIVSPNNETFFYFRLFVDYFGESTHPFDVQQEENRIAGEVEIPDEIKKEIRYARVGQGKYRRGLLEECPFCPITIVTDDRLLIASHIKPWIDSNEIEKIDPKNGFMLTPTYDFLFDRGFITFTDDKKIQISPWLSKITCSRLSISQDKKYPMLPVEGRELYLDFHRRNIFKS